MSRRDEPPAEADAFLGAALPALLPLLVWAAHFAAVYVIASLGCSVGAAAPEGALRDIAVGPLVGVATAVALIVLAGLCWRAVGDWRHGALQRGGSRGVRLGAAALALVGVLWSLVPLLAGRLCPAGG